MPQIELEDMWLVFTEVLSPYIEAVDDIGAAARYIGKYLHMQSYHVRKYIMSAGSVVSGLGVLVVVVQTELWRAS